MNSTPRTTTFLFTDLENSTSLWEHHPVLMQELTARHDALLREAVLAHRGRVVKSTGDGFHAAFETANDGLAAAVAGQQALVKEDWPAETGALRVRMGLHTGISRERDGDYYGPEVNRAARVMDVAHGRQVLVSGATAALVQTSLPEEVTLTDLGEHRLRGLGAAEQIFQVCHLALPTEFPPLRSLTAYKHNLPVQLSTFVGRQKELAQVKRLLKDTHLLTLLGPGGTGKTRLMLESAEEMVADFSNGVWLVELAPLTDPDLIAERVAAALTVQEQPGREMIDTLIDYLRRKELLLLLDNVEHLVADAAGLAEQLLTQCPKLKMLVTGREALFIDGETTLQIPSLSLPGRKTGATFAEVRASEGVQLFLIRAQAIRPGFELTPENAHAIAEIVRRLDGIPLALELAAARTRMLTVEQIAERLTDRFRLLTGGRRTALPRQQTLQALIDWSWNLLDEKERLLLQRLSVFSGGWSLQAAQAVASDKILDEFDVFDGLEQLVNKSLVTVKYPEASKARYGMLESVRQYGRDRLFESGEGETLRDNHARYFLAFAEEAEPHLTSSTMLPWVERVTQELDNLRAVLGWTLDGRPELALRMGSALVNNETYWLTPREAQAWLGPVVEVTRSLLDDEESGVRVVDFIKALIGLAYAYGWQGNSEAVVRLSNEAVDLARTYDEPRLLVLAIGGKYVVEPFGISVEAMPELEEAIAVGRANDVDRELLYVLGVYGVVLFREGQVEAAVQYLEEALAKVRKINNPRLNAGAFAVRHIMALMRGDLDEAKRYALLAMQNYDAFGDQRGSLLSKSSLAHVLRWQGKFDEAESYYRRTIVGWQALGQPAAVAHQVECLAYIAIVRGKYARAAQMLGAAKRAREELDSLSKDPREIADLGQAMEQLAAAMGEESRDQMLSEGSLLGLDESVQMALDRSQ